MRSLNGLLVVGLLVSLALAGCLGGPDGEGAISVASFEAAHDRNTGSITGVVLDDSLLPIFEARVSLLTPNGSAVYLVVRTNEAGRYAFNFIPAGPYQVEAQASGYEAAVVSVEVFAGQVVTDASFRLVPGFADVAYYVTDRLSRMVGGGTLKYGFECSQTPWQPYTPSSLASVLGKYCIGGNTCPQQTGCSDVSSGCQGSYSKERNAKDNGYGGTSYLGGYRDLLLNESDWQTQLAEVTWRPSSAVSGRGVLYEILGPNVTNSDGGHNSRCGGINQSDPRDFLALSDKPPLRIEINEDLLAARHVKAEDRCCDWRWRLFPGWCDLGNCARWGPDANALGVIAPTRVDVYYTIFFKERAPPGWSILPDR